MALRFSSKEKLAQKVRDLRKNMGMSAPQFSRKTGIPTQVIYNIEHGSKQMIMIDDLYALIDIGLNIGEIEEEEETAQAFVERIWNTRPGYLSSFCNMLRVRYG
jgi:transcriptional regulator with XRE-family HTH domain